MGNSMLVLTHLAHLLCFGWAVAHTHTRTRHWLSFLSPRQKELARQMIIFFPRSVPISTLPPNSETCCRTSGKHLPSPGNWAEGDHSLVSISHFFHPLPTHIPSKRKGSPFLQWLHPLKGNVCEEVTDMPTTDCAPQRQRTGHLRCL